MASQLTGDLNVVAQFSLPAVNRLLAAMHVIQRFPHSLSLRVDDIPQPPGGAQPNVFEILDAVGESVVDPERIRVHHVGGGPSVALADRFSRLAGIVNADAQLSRTSLVPSRLQGRAQLQLAPPALEIADASASKIKVRIPITSRYFADRDTPLASEFAKGDLVLSTAVSQITSQAGNVVDIDLRSNAVQAAFVPTWSSRTLSAEDRAGINLLISNALKASVLPSNNTLPSNIRSMKFKAHSGAEQAVAVLLNLTSAPGNPATATRVFLGGSDFAFGVGADVIKAALQPAIDQLENTAIPPFSFHVGFPIYSTVTYTVSISSAKVEFEAGRILLTIRGHASDNKIWAPSFDFTVKQAVGLQVDGSTAELVMGDLSLDTSSWIADRFRGAARGPLETARDRALNQAGVKASVRRMLDADRNLGGFLRSLLTPARPDGQPQPQPLGFGLTYSSSEISAAGIVLRGALAVADWPPAHVEFEELPAGSGGGLADSINPSGPEYSAFKTWIAGGTIQSFQWKRAGDTAPGLPDDKKFVLLSEGPIILDVDAPPESSPHGHLPAFQPMCLTIRGTRLSSSGAIAPQAVTASYCAFNWFPLVDLNVVEAQPVPLVPLTRPGSRGEIEVIGHAPAVREDKGKGRPNLIVHFAGGDSAQQLERLTDALQKSGRTNAATAIVGVLSPDEMARARHVAPGVIYVEQRDDAWERLWRVKVGKRPATFVIDPRGKVAWEHGGEIDVSVVAEALRRVLAAGSLLSISTVTSGVRIGHAPPNFVFSHAEASDLTLRKLAGRPTILVFWRSASAPSVEAIRAVMAAPPHQAWKGAVVLAINDGESREVAEKAAAAAGLTATVVPDPTRSISKAYGVSAWPTVVFLDSRGVVREVRHGRGPTEDTHEVYQDAVRASTQ